jgi:hypothetical protein
VLPLTRILGNLWQHVNLIVNGLADAPGWETRCSGQFAWDLTLGHLARARRNTLTDFGGLIFAPEIPSLRPPKNFHRNFSATGEFKYFAAFCDRLVRALRAFERPLAFTGPSPGLRCAMGRQENFGTGR